MAKYLQLYTAARLYMTHDDCHV